MKGNPLHSMWVKAFIQIFVLMALPILAFTFFANQITQRSLLEQRRQSDLNALQALDSNLSTLLDSAETVGKIIASDENIKDFLKEAAAFANEGNRSLYAQMDSSRLLKGYLSAAEHLKAASLMDKDGYFVGERVLYCDRLQWYFNTSFFERVNSEAPTWSDTFSIKKISDDEITRVFSVLIPVRGQKDSLLGYVVLYLDTVQIKRLLTNMNNEIFILDRSDTQGVVASKQDIPFYISFFDVRKINYNLLREDSSVIATSSVGRIVVTTQAYPRCNLQFVLASEYEHIKNEADRRYPQIVIFGVYGVLFSLLAAFVNAKSVTTPAVRLKTVMQKVKDGDSSLRYQTQSKDEIAELGATFNSLLDEIYVHQELKRKLQLQIMQEQIRPHFLYNVLEMVSSLVRDKMYTEALTSIQSLSRFYRISLSKGSDIIYIQQEMQLIESYLTLQQLRYTEFMDFTVSIHPSILSGSVPKLTLQPIIENAIYHGLKGRREKGLLCVTGYREKNRAVFEIYDNGVGMSADELARVRQLISGFESEEPAEHFGVASVAKRLNLFCDNNAEMIIDSKQNQYTNVTISFPI